MLEARSVKKLIFLCVLLTLLVFISCETQKKTDLVPRDLEQHIQNLKAADSLYTAGSYTCLKDAYDIYENLLDAPFQQEATAEKLFKTALLLSLRVKELGIINSKYIRRAEELISTYPHLSEFENTIKFAATIPYTIKGVVLGFNTGGPNLGTYYDWIKTNVRPLNDEFKASVERTEFHAYLYVYFFENFSYQLDEDYDFRRLIDLFPYSPTIKYRVALFYEKDKDLLEKTLEMEPSFKEAHLFLGNKAFGEKKLLTAEKHFRKAYEILPDSLSVLIFLAGVHFALEENDESIGFYEDALHIAPDFREALLGKAICLGYMGKHEYAIQVLKELIRMGRYYMGESYFWLAWNQHELGLIEDAQKNVEKTKNYLVGHVEVLALQGKISFKLGNLDESEKYFYQAIRLNPNHCDSVYHMAKIHALREDWEKTGTHYEKAAICYKKQESAIDARIKEIEESPMSLERKAKLILRKKAQMRKAALTKATCYYNGAAGYFNCGLKDKALIFAAYAAQEKAFVDRAEDLIKKIESR
jgi:tetratricopeptide (TPR) repeat protein